MKAIAWIVPTLLVFCARQAYPQPPQIQTGGIVNAASFTPVLARCGLAAVFGTNLSDTTASAASIPLPSSLGGAQVIVNGTAAPLFYASPGQINFQVPCEMPLSGGMGIYVTTSVGASTAQTAMIAPYAPAVFTYWRTPTALDPVVVHLDNSLVTPDKPAKPGEVLTVYATGIGNLSPLPVTGAASPASPPSATVNMPTATLGNGAASVSWAGMTPSMVGLAQINIQLPSSFPAVSTLPLLFSFAGATSQSVNLAVQGGSGSPSNVLVSDTFNRANAPACNLGEADLALGGSGAHYYEPLVTTSPMFGVSVASGALQSNSADYSGVQFTASSDGCGNRTSGETIGQDLDIKVDLFLPANSAGMVQAGPYFRGISVQSGGGVLNTTGYWVFLTNKGEVRVHLLIPTSGTPIIASTNIPASFDATVYHTLETVAKGAALQVSLDGNGLNFYTQCLNDIAAPSGFQCTGTPVPTVSLPAQEQHNDGTAGIFFGDEDNRGKLSGQRVRNLIVARAQ